MRNKIAVIIGAGAAGLSAAYHLLTLSDEIKPVIIEETDTAGGLAKTIFIEKNGTDIGGHRFFTKNNEVFDFWTKFLPLAGYPAADDIFLNRAITTDINGPDPESINNVMLKRKRFSRIYFQNCLIDYPIKFNFETFAALGLNHTISCGLSYLKSCFYKVDELNLEDFMINRFGEVLYKLFFENYTKKVWGVHPSKISKEWGQQRIKGVSLSKIIYNAILTTLKIKNKKETSLIEEYFYPKLGSQQLWNLIADDIVQNGGEILFNSKAVSIKKEEDKISSIKILDKNTNEIKEIEGSFFISTMPLKNLITSINDVAEDIREFAENLQYRDFILVNFICSEFKLQNNTNFPTIKNICPDSWIYLQDKDIKAGRLNIMNHFSPYIICDYKNEIVCNLEYFCNENDEFWQKTDDEISLFAISEMEKLKITQKEYIKSVKCLRFKKAYPAYFGSYEHIDKIREYINEIKNLYCIGRNGQHKYNNMDHSILSGIEAARVITGQKDKYNLWKINTDDEYHEIKYE